MEGIQQAAAIATVFGLLSATLWWLRRQGLAGITVGRKPAKQLETLEKLTLGPQHTLHLVRMGETTLLVAASPAGCAVVREVAGSREVGQ